MITPSITSGAGKPGGVLAARPKEAPEERTAGVGEDFGALFTLWLQQGAIGRGPASADGSSAEHLSAFERTVASKPGRGSPLRADDARAAGRSPAPNAPSPDPLRNRTPRTQPARDRQETSPHAQSPGQGAYGMERGAVTDSRAGSAAAAPRNTPGEAHDRTSGQGKAHRKDTAETRPEGAAPDGQNHQGVQARRETPDRQRDAASGNEASGSEAARDAEGRPLAETGSADAERDGAKIQQQGLRIVEGQKLPATAGETAVPLGAQGAFVAGEWPGRNGTAMAAPAGSADARGMALVESGLGGSGQLVAGSAALAQDSGQTPGANPDVSLRVTADRMEGANLTEAGMPAAAASEPGKAQDGPWIQVTASLTEDAALLATPDGVSSDPFAASEGNLGDVVPGEFVSGDPQDLPAPEELMIAGRRGTDAARTDSMRLSFQGDRMAGLSGDGSAHEAPAASGGMGLAGRYAAGLGVVPGSAGGSPAGSGFGGRGSGAEAQGRQQSAGNAQTRLSSAVAGQPAAADQAEGGIATQIDQQTAKQPAMQPGASGARPTGFAADSAESAGNNRTAGDGMAAGIEAARPGARVAHGSSGVRLDPARAAREPGLDLEAARSNASATPARAVRVDLPGDAGGESLRLRFLQRGIGNASAIDVRIQGASEQGVREIRSEIPALLERLGSAGFRTAAATETGSAQSDGHGASREGTHARHGAWSGPGQGESGSSHGQGDEPARSPHQHPGDAGTSRGRRSPVDFEEALRTLGGAVPSYGTDPRGHQEG